MENDFFGLKQGQDLGNWAVHPRQEFPGVPSRYSASNYNANVELALLFYMVFSKIVPDNSGM